MGSQPSYIKERRSGEEIAAFILEYTGAECIDARRDVRQYVFEDYISEYDRIVFATLASSTVKEEPFIKRYLAKLASDVVENDRAAEAVSGGKECALSFECAAF